MPFQKKDRDTVRSISEITHFLSMHKARDSIPVPQIRMKLNLAALIIIQISEESENY